MGLIENLTSRIFIDTSAWIEIILKNEIYHKQMAGYFLTANKKGAKFFTCDYVLDEAWTRLITNHSFLSAKFLREKVGFNVQPLLENI